MIDERLKEKLEKQSIEEILVKLRTTQIDEKERIGAIIKTLVNKEFFFIHQFVSMMINEQLRIGHNKDYTLSDLVEKMPWKRSQLSVKLQKAVEEVVVIHDKRKYSLNHEHIIVKKLWRFFTEPNCYENQQKEVKEIKELLKTREKLEEELAVLKQKIKETRKYKHMDDKDLNEICQEIADTLENDDEFDRKEDLIEFFKQNKEILFGYKKVENN